MMQPPAMPPDPVPMADCSDLDLCPKAIDALSERIAILDARGEIVWVNAAWQRFAEQPEVPAFAAARVGMNYLDVCHEAQHERQLAQDTLYGIYSVLEGLLERFSLEYCLKRAEGAAEWYRMIASPLRRDAGGLVLSHVEITARKLAEQERDRLNLEVRDLLETLAALNALRPVCAACGRPRGDQSFLRRAQDLLAKQAELGSFGACPECLAKIPPHNPQE